MIGWMISNLLSRLFVFLMQFWSLYILFYAKINFNILYTYLSNIFYVTITYTKNNETKLFKNMNGLELKQSTPKAVDMKKEASLIVRGGQ